MSGKIKGIYLQPQSENGDRGSSENDKLAVFDLVAQLVEQMTLNHWVEGSSPSQVTNRKRKQHCFDLVAQLVEQMTLNHWVEGSSPSQVTKKEGIAIDVFLFCFLHHSWRIEAENLR